MIVISRMKNESLVINQNITITVVEIRGDKVRLGIEHPKDVPVHRKEVYEAIQRAAAEPVNLSPSPSAPVAAPPRVDKVAQLAEMLQSRLGVAVSRDLVIQALRDAGIEV